MTGRRIPCGTGAMDVFLDPNIDMETDKSMVHDTCALQPPTANGNGLNNVIYDDYHAAAAVNSKKRGGGVDFDADDDDSFMDESGW